jgi:hypothetical protein
MTTMSTLAAVRDLAVSSTNEAIDTEALLATEDKLHDWEDEAQVPVQEELRPRRSTRTRALSTHYQGKDWTR